MRYYRQRPIKGGRIPLPACVEKMIWKEVDNLAKRFHVSRSFVIATALADAFAIDIDERFDQVKQRKN